MLTLCLLDQMYVDLVTMPTAVLDGKRYLEGTNVLFVSDYPLFFLL